MMTASDDRGMQPHARLEIEADVAQIAAVRRFVRDHVPPTADHIVADIVLAASELATNAIEHGDGGRVIVELGDDDHDVVLRVHSPGASIGVTGPADWGLTVGDAVTGRGLGIVRAVTDELAIHRTESHLVTAARFRL